MEPTTISVGLEQASVEGSLEATVRKFGDAFNRLKANELASFWAEEGTVLNPFGNYGKGRSDVERVLHEDAEKLLEGTRTKVTITGARKIADDCVLLDVDNEVENYRMPDGTRGPAKIHVVVLAQKKGEAWQWLDVRAYMLRERPQPLH